MKTILIAIPTNKYIEPESFKSIYDLHIPSGYTTEFQFFYGYQVDQVRNLIADWGKNYDYLFCVDSDIVLPVDCLSKMIAADKDIISGLYIQRFHDRHDLEVYDSNGRIPYEYIEGRGVIEIISCGFGCVLVKSEVLRTMEYPHFVYKSAINHNDTISEDTYFCHKARESGFRVWADTSITCDHVGSTTYKVKSKSIETRLDELYNMHNLLPQSHISYIDKMNIKPNVVYDIGASTLHWSTNMRNLWPNSRMIMFEAMDECSYLYKKHGYEYFTGVLSDTDDKEVNYYQNLYNPAGNSYYKENSSFYVNSDIVVKKTHKLDTVVWNNNFPYPDLIKIDVQGAELDVLRGAEECLSHASDLIIELQHKEYNIGSPSADEVIQYLKSRGFKLISNFCYTDHDGDYHFTKN